VSSPTRDPSTGTTTRRRTLLIFASLITLVVMLMFGLSLLSRRAPDVGLQNGRLRPCPDSPNCVCSFDTDDEHAIAPLDGGNDPAATFDRLRVLLQSMSRVQVVTDEGNYLHAGFTTPLLRFVDDVEFLLDADAGVIHIRSASRVGHSDLGVNRKRVEQLRERLRTG
jgi:uncharacterized protein (DUF1499 family)